MFYVCEKVDLFNLIMAQKAPNRMKKIKRIKTELGAKQTEKNKTN